MDAVVEGRAVVVLVVVVVADIVVLVLSTGLWDRTSLRWLLVPGVEQQEPMRKPSAQVPSLLPLDRRHSQANIHVPVSPFELEQGFSLILRHVTDESSRVVKKRKSKVRSCWQAGTSLLPGNKRQDTRRKERMERMGDEEDEGLRLVTHDEMMVMRMGHDDEDGEGEGDVIGFSGVSGSGIDQR